MSKKQGPQGAGGCIDVFPECPKIHLVEAARMLPKLGLFCLLTVSIAIFAMRTAGNATTLRFPITNYLMSSPMQMAKVFGEPNSAIPGLENHMLHNGRGVGECKRVYWEHKFAESSVNLKFSGGYLTSIKIQRSGKGDPFPHSPGAYVATEKIGSKKIDFRLLACDDAGENLRVRTSFKASHWQGKMTTQTPTSFSSRKLSEDGTYKLSYDWSVFWNTSLVIDFDASVLEADSVLFGAGSPIFGYIVQGEKIPRKILDEIQGR